MANAKKCNRCGALYDPLSLGERRAAQFNNPWFKDEKAFRNNTIDCYLLGSKDVFSLTFKDCVVDLCPDCTEDFTLFMSNSPLAIRSLTIPAENAKGYGDDIERA